MNHGSKETLTSPGLPWHDSTALRGPLVGSLLLQSFASWGSYSGYSVSIFKRRSMWICDRDRTGRRNRTLYPGSVLDRRCIVVQRSPHSDGNEVDWRSQTSNGRLSPLHHAPLWQVIITPWQPVGH